MKFTSYVYAQPEAIPTTEEGRAVPQGDRYLKAVRAAGFDPEDPEVSMVRLSAAWNGHRKGALVVTGLTISGYPFAVQD